MTPQTSFALTIATDNAAFEEWQTETARILRAVADRLDRDDGRDDQARGKIQDANGNTVGEWQHKKLNTAPSFPADLYRTAELAGADIARFLNLKADKDGRFKTSWGTKTGLGLYLSLRRVVAEGLEP